MDSEFDEFDISFVVLDHQSWQSRKRLSLKTVMKWEDEIQEQFTFETDHDQQDLVVKAICKVCSQHFRTLESNAKYKGKVLTDAVNYPFYGKDY